MSTPPSLTVPTPYGAGAEEAAARGGSYGPVIGMLAVVVVLAAAAVAVGRLCFGRRGRDLEAWVERACGPCVGVVTTRAATAAGAPKEEEEGGGSGTTEQPPPPPPQEEGTERAEAGGGA